MVKVGVLTCLALAVGFGGFWYLLPRSEMFGMFVGGTEVDVVRVASSFAATIAGVMLGAAYRALRQLRAAGRAKILDVQGFARDLLRSVDLWLGLASAPIVYGLLLQATHGMTFAGLVVVALQNGFCCHTVIDQFVEGGDPQARSEGSGGRRV